MGQDVFTTSRQVTPGINSNSLQIYIRKEGEKRDVKGMDGGEGEGWTRRDDKHIKGYLPFSMTFALI